MADGDGDAHEGAYDPMKDPARRPRRSNDPGWNYGYWLKPPDVNIVVCNLCGKITKGGIKRHKEHLAATGGDATGCPNVTTQIRREMLQYLENNRRNKRQPDDDDDDVVEVDSTTRTPTIQCSTTRQSSGTAAKRNKKAFAVKMSGKKCQDVAAKSIVSMLRKKPEDVVDERRSGCSQSTMESSTKTPEERHYVSMQWALFFYECGIPFNVASCRQFQIAIEASCQYGPGYKPPSPHELREPLLKDCVKETKLLRAQHEVAWKQYGCTLMSDGWSDKKGRHLINFLVNSPEGTYFLESVDASSECQDARMIADLLEKRIEDVGKENVVQVVTDNGANYKAAGKLLMERIPTLYWSPCACHCLDLMLEDIGKLKAFKKPIARGRRVTTFIYRHGRILSLMRKATGGLDLVRPAATRFATSYLALKSLVTHKQALRSLFTCQAWVGNKLAKTAAGLNVQEIILSAEWWHSVEDCLRASAPLLRALRIADGDEVPAMPEMTAVMRFAKERIKLGFPHQNKQALLKKIIDIVDKRWETQMDHPLYGAALFLNPGKFFSIVKSGDDALVGELRSCFNDVLAKMVLDVQTRNKIDTQSVLYEDQRDTFANLMAIQNISEKNPLDWWRSYGGRAIELQRFAKRIVSLCASSSGCERNWSTFEFISIVEERNGKKDGKNGCCVGSTTRKFKAASMVVLTLELVDRLKRANQGVLVQLDGVESFLQAVSDMVKESKSLPGFFADVEDTIKDHSSLKAQLEQKGEEAAELKEQLKKEIQAKDLFQEQLKQEMQDKDLFQEQLKQEMEAKTLLEEQLRKKTEEEAALRQQMATMMEQMQRKGAEAKKTTAQLETQATKLNEEIRKLNALPKSRDEENEQKFKELEGVVKTLGDQRAACSAQNVSGSVPSSVQTRSSTRK